MWGALSDVKTGLRLQLLLVVASAVILGSECRGTRNYILLYQIRDSFTLPVFISPRNRVARLYPQALGSLFVASYDSQGYSASTRGLPRLFWESRYIATAWTTQKTQFYCNNSCVTQQLVTQNPVPTVSRSGRYRKQLHLLLLVEPCLYSCCLATR
jgi:hypothetical protein